MKSDKKAVFLRQPGVARTSVPCPPLSPALRDKFQKLHQLALDFGRATADANPGHKNKQ